MIKLNVPEIKSFLKIEIFLNSERLILFFFITHSNTLPFMRV